MSNPVKIAFAAAVLGGLFWLITNAKKWATKITYNVQSVGLPFVSLGKLALPVKIEITNPTPLAVPISDVKILLSLLVNGMWVPFGKVNTGAIDLKPGALDKTFNVALDVASIKSIAATHLTARQVASLLKPDLKADVIVNIQGIDLPGQTYTQKILLTDLLRNAA